MELKSEVLPGSADPSDEIASFRAKPAVRRIRITSIVIIYIALLAGQKYFSSLSGDPSITYNVYSICGVLSQIQVLMSIFLVMAEAKTGYITSMLLCGLSAAITGSMLLRGNISISAGFTMYIGCMIIISAMRYLGKKIELYIHELIVHKNEVVRMYSETRRAEAELAEQNEKLRKSSQLMLQKQAEVNELSYFDTLTGLPNQKMIVNFLESCIVDCSPTGKKCHVIFLDIDDFRKINDTMGRAAGDHVIRELVERWRPLVGQGDMLGRFGGDKFIIVSMRFDDDSDAAAYALQFSHSSRDVFRFGSRQMFLALNIGISSFPLDGVEPYVIINNANIAMYRAKELKQDGIELFMPEMKRDLVTRVSLEFHLQTALLKNELHLVYQPQYSISDNSLRGLEVLVRWTSSEFGNVPPSRFIPIAEESNQIIRIGEWIFETACYEYLRNVSQFDKPPVLTVNISSIQLANPQFVTMVKTVLDRTGFNPSLLEFEITESVCISAFNEIIPVIEKLSAEGVRFSLDDFGTGYSSLHYLQILPVKAVKIDRSFVSTIGVDEKKALMVKVIIDLFHNLGLEVIAEGIEEKHQLSHLRDLHCDYAQGFYCARPGAIADVKNSMTE